MVEVSPRLESYNLTPGQIQFFNDNGFLLIEDFFNTEEHQTLDIYCSEFQKWGNEKGKWMQYYEVNTITGKNMLCRTENFTPYHEGMKSYVESPRLMEVLKKLYSEEYVLFKEKVNYKLPGGGGYPAHQDAPSFTQFGQYSHTTVMFTIDATTLENGCLEVVPGSHKNVYEKRILPREEDGAIANNWCKKENWVPVYCNLGSILIFCAYLAHRSGDNVTDKSRVSVYLTYNGNTEGYLRDRYYEEKRKEFPPSYEREIGKDYSEGAKLHNFATPIL